MYVQTDFALDATSKPCTIRVIAFTTDDGHFRTVVERHEPGLEPLVIGQTVVTLPTPAIEHQAKVANGNGKQKAIDSKPLSVS